MPLFPYEPFDPIDYSAIPKDARPQLLFARNISYSIPRILTQYPQGLILLAVLLFFILNYLFQFSLLLSLLFFTLSLVLGSLWCGEAVRHYADVASLDKRLAIGARKKIREHFATDPTLHGLAPFIFPSIISLLAYVLAYWLAPNSRSILLPIIVHLFVASVFWQIMLDLKDPNKRSVFLKAILLWLQREHSKRIPMAFVSDRTSHMQRIAWVILIAILYAITLPKLAFYNPVILLFESQQSISRHYPIPQRLTSSMPYAVGPSQNSYLDHLAIESERQMEIRNSKMKQSRDFTEEDQKILENAAQAKNIIDYQLTKIRSDPAGVLVASVHSLTSQPLTVLVCWLLGLIIFALDISILLVGSLLGVISGVEKVDEQIEAHIAFENQWQGIVSRLEQSNDDSEKESLFLGFYGD